MNSKKIPTCIGFIMDGNRRWAKERGLPTIEGHRRGAENLKKVMQATWDMGVHYAILYAFSTENWNRSKEEVDAMLKLAEEFLTLGLKDLKERVQIRFIGDIKQFSQKLQELMRHIEEETTRNEEGVLAFALSYGGRAEILNATNKLLQEEKRSITEEEFSNYLWTREIPDPDLVIRTSGERRLSNFLPWQSVYSELFFTDTYWPDFSREELSGMLEEYAARERRHGK